MSSHPYPAGYCRRASRHEHLLGVPTLLTSAADALEVVAAALHVPERVETIALLLDDDRRGRTVVVVDGTEPADSLIEVVECLCDAMSDEGGQLVVASVRPPRDGPTSVSPEPRAPEIPPAECTAGSPATRR